MNRQVKPSYEFGPFRLDTAEHVLLRRGHPVPLTPKVFDVLCVLVQNNGHLVEKEELLKEVWPDSFVEESNLNHSISILRKALSEGSSGHRYIETVPKRGYRFAAEVRQSWQEGAEFVVQERNRSIISIKQEEESELTQTDMDSGRKSMAIPSAKPLVVYVAVGALAVLSALSYLILRPTLTGREPAATVTPIHKQVTFTGKAGSPAISPDGKSIAYVSRQSEKEVSVMVQDLAGGQPLVVCDAQECVRLRWSPDGSELMALARYHGRNGVFLVPRLGGTPRLLAAGVLPPACWSPDGSQVAVPMRKKISFLKKFTGEEKSISLEGSFQWIWDTDWSPSGNVILFVAREGQARFGIWTIKTDGSQQHKVLEDTAEIPSARWSSQGDAIYYLRRGEQTMGVWKIRVPSRSEKQRPTPSAVMTGLEADGSFALSADGNRLVYARNPSLSNLWLASVTGSGKDSRIKTKQLTKGTSLIERPSVSPDGKWIAFNIGHHPTANLYGMPIEGGSPKQLTFLNSYNVGPVWSPNGKRIAFASTQDGKPSVWIVSADGGTPRRLSMNEISDTFHLVWSPGSNILYQRPGNRNYSILNPETRAERPLVKNDAVGWMFFPIYSPDAERIAVVWNRGHDGGIWAISVSDSSETLVCKPEPYPFLIGWSADGKWIYAFDGTRAASRGPSTAIGETMTGTRIMMIPSSGGEARILVTLPFEEIGSMSMTPDGKHFVCTVYESRTDVWMVERFDAAEESQTVR